jgi:hypothetical protein
LPTLRSVFDPSPCVVEALVHSSCPGRSAKRVFALDVQGIHVLLSWMLQRRGWPGRGPAMTACGKLIRRANQLLKNRSDLPVCQDPFSKIFRF